MTPGKRQDASRDKKTSVRASVSFDPGDYRALEKLASIAWVVRDEVNEYLRRSGAQQ